MSYCSFLQKNICFEAIRRGFFYSAKESRRRPLAQRRRWLFSAYPAGLFVSLVGKKDKNVAFHVGKTDKKPYICIGKTDKRMLKRKIDSYLEQFYERTNNFAMTM